MKYIYFERQDGHFNKNIISVIKEKFGIGLPKEIRSLLN